MGILPTPFDYKSTLTEEQLDVFTEALIFDDFGSFEGYKTIRNLSEIVDRNLSKRSEPIAYSGDTLVRYSTRVEQNKNKLKIAQVRKFLSLEARDGEKDDKMVYGTIDENKVFANYQDKAIKSTKDFDEMEDVKHSIRTYHSIKMTFEVEEGVDLDTLLYRSLQGVPSAVDKTREVVEKHPFMGKIIKDIMKASTWGYDVLPELD